MARPDIDVTAAGVDEEIPKPASAGSSKSNSLVSPLKSAQQEGELRIPPRLERRRSSYSSSVCQSVYQWLMSIPPQQYPLAPQQVGKVCDDLSELHKGNESEEPFNSCVAVLRHLREWKIDVFDTSVYVSFVEQYSKAVSPFLRTVDAQVDRALSKFGITKETQLAEKWNEMYSELRECYVLDTGGKLVPITTFDDSLRSLAEQLINGKHIAAHLG